MATEIRESNAILHVRFGGRSLDLPLAGLDLSNQSPDREVKHRLATYLEVAPRALDPYVVDRHENGNLTVRPEAVFG